MDFKYTVLPGDQIAITTGGVTKIHCAKDYLRQLSIQVVSSFKDKSRKPWILIIKSQCLTTADFRTQEFRFSSRRQAEQAHSMLLQQLELPGETIAVPAVSVDRFTRSSKFWAAFGTAILAGAFLLSPAPSKPQVYDPSVAYSTPDVAAHGKLDDASFKTLASLADKTGIQISREASGNGAKRPRFYVLSQPGSSFDLHLAELSADYDPVVIPFWIENDESGVALRALSHVYCASNPGSQWLAYAKGGPVEANFAACQWQDLARMNVLAGPITGLDHVVEKLPFIIAPNGGAHEGGVDTTDPVGSLKAWLEANTPPKKDEQGSVAK